MILSTEKVQPNLESALLVQIFASNFTRWKESYSGFCFLEGEYGIDGVACGVPCVIGRNGIEDIIELELNDKEKEQMAHTCSVIKDYCERAEKVQ